MRIEAQNRNEQNGAAWLEKELEGETDGVHLPEIHKYYPARTVHVQHTPARE